METIVCPLCASNGMRPYRTLVDRFSAETFTLVQCTQCSLVYLNPRPTIDEIGHYYPEAYEPYEAGGDVTGHQRRLRTMQLDFAETFAGKSGRLLDIGCASGDFMWVARQRGWQVAGIEPSHSAAEMARQRGLTVTVGSAETALTDHRDLDLITMWDVLEHLHQPKAVLQQCAQALKPNGWLVFAIPNRNSFDHTLFGQDWVGWEAPRHLSFFDSATLPRLLAETGFNAASQACLAGGKGVFDLSFQTKYPTFSHSAAGKRTRTVLGMALWPYRQISYALGRGSIVTYAAQRASG